MVGDLFILEGRDLGQAKGCLYFVQTQFSRAESCALSILCIFCMSFDIFVVGVIISIRYGFFGIKGDVTRKKEFGAQVPDLIRDGKHMRM